ncbi:MAG: hypothetical protein QG564_1410 [Campylobacterota bacterium]|nr:hypothetical protein [Campylobacterota bacterium]
MSKKIILSACVASATLMFSGCGGSSSSETSAEATGTFIDAAVAGLSYACDTSGKNGETDGSGKFTCEEGDSISFKLGAVTFGPVEVEDGMIVTPYILYPKNDTAAVNLAQLLLTLDGDGNPDNEITLDPKQVEEIITNPLDATNSEFEGDAQQFLNQANLILVDEQTAIDHLKESDTEAPVVTLLGEETVTIMVNTGMVNTGYTDAGATAHDAFEGAIDPKESGSVNTAAAGTYSITYTATDKAGNSAHKTRTVIVQEEPVVDTTPPIVTLHGEATVTITVGATYSDAGATAIDDIDGELTPIMSGSIDTNTEGTYTITYTATDAAGNVGTATRTVIIKEPVIEDTTPPQITLNGENSITVYMGTAFVDPGASAIDEVDGSVNVTTSGTVDTGKVGNYTITYTATDAAGNTATLTRTVNVIECQNVNPITGGCEDEPTGPTEPTDPDEPTEPTECQVYNPITGECED